eukprot:355325-Chlamydomonas_euryale.AAC.4
MRRVAGTTCWMSSGLREGGGGGMEGGWQRGRDGRRGAGTTRWVSSGLREGGWAAGWREGGKEAGMEGGRQGGRERKGEHTKGRGTTKQMPRGVPW